VLANRDWERMLSFYSFLKELATPRDQEADPAGSIRFEAWLGSRGPRS
jgi:hypothetical protein